MFPPCIDLRLLLPERYIAGSKVPVVSSLSLVFKSEVVFTGVCHLGNNIQELPPFRFLVQNCGFGEMALRVRNNKFVVALAINGESHLIYPLGPEVHTD